MNYVRVGGYIPPQPIEDYNDLPNIPVINQDLAASGFTPVANTYYKHAGTTTDTFTQGVIYLYNGTGYVALDGSVSGLATVAKTGSYNDLLDKPTIPTDYVPNTRKVNNKALSSDITLDASDVRALPTAGGTVTGNLTVGGNLTINGTTTTVDSTTLKVKDKLIEVAKDNTAKLTTPAGIVVPKYDGTSYGALVINGDGNAQVGDVKLDASGNIDVTNSDLQTLATRTGLVGGNLVQYDSSALTLKDAGKKISDLALKTELSGKANLSGGNTFSGVQTINAPTNVSGSEQTTMKVKTSNGGAIIFGKEGANSGTMIRLDQADGTCRLRFRSSATAGAMVWEQPEQGAHLYVDLGKDGSDKHRVTFPNSAGTLALTSQVNAKYTKPSGGIPKTDLESAVQTSLGKADNALSLDGGTINKSKTIKMDASANSDGANLKWGTVNSKNPYIGYASDQVDGTFVVGSLLGTNYASGLAIGGGSGNLLWKGTKVATTSDIPTNYVTTDTTQTISGAKTFTSDVVVNKATPKFNMKLSELTNGTTPSANQFGEVCFLDKNGVYEGGIRFDSPTNGENRTKLSTNSFGTTHSNYVGLFAKKNASSVTATDIWRFIPNQDAVIDLGQSDLRWRNVRAVTTYSNVYGSDLCSTNSLRLKDPNITRGTNQAASGGKQNYYRAININDKNNHKGVAVEWGYLCEKNSNGNTTKHVSELNLLVYPPNTTDNANFVKVALGKRSDGTTYFTYAGNQVVTTQNFSLSGTTLTITL